MELGGLPAHAVTPTREDLAYMAGFFDADGGVYTTVETEKDTGKEYPRIRVGCFQKTPEPLHFFQQFFGGHVYKQKDGMWRWQRGGIDFALTFHRLVGPRLIVKKETLNDAIESFISRSSRPRS